MRIINYSMSASTFTIPRLDRSRFARSMGPRAAVASMFFLSGGVFGVWASRIPSIVERFSIDKDLLGLLLLCLAGGAILSFPLAGKISDKIGAAVLTRILSVLCCVSLSLIACASSLSALPFFMIVFGAAHGSMNVAMNAWGSEVEKHIGKPIMPSFHAMFSLGAGAGSATGYIAIKFGFGLLSHFIITGCSLLVLALFLSRHPWHSRTPSSPSKAFAFPQKSLTMIGIISLASSFGEGVVTDWSAVYLVSVLEASSAQAALGFLIYSTCMMIVRLSAGEIIHRMGPVMVARISGGGGILGSLLVVVSQNLEQALVGFAFMGIGYAVIMPMAISRAAQEVKVETGVAIASVSTFGYGGMLLGPPIVGFIASLTSLRISFSLLVALALLIVVFSGFLHRPR